MLGRDKFRRWLSTDEALAYVGFLGEHAQLVDDPPPESGHTRDPDDDYLVALARAAGVSAIVSGDKDLVDLRDARPVVRTPRQLLDLLDKNVGG